MYRVDDDRNRPGASARSTEHAWALCRALADARRAGALAGLSPGTHLSLAADGAPVLVPAARGDTAQPGEPELLRGTDGGWIIGAGWAPAARALLQLYLPLLSVDQGRGYLIAHLGQSIDGRIATRCGDSRELSCTANLVHLHRLRALSDAVLIGRETACLDNPRLTTRLVSGPHPVRVIVDPVLRTPGDLRVFIDDEAPTLLVCADDHLERAARRFGRERVVAVTPQPDGRLAPAAIRAVLAERGLTAVFVEGGGVTVSRFVEAGCADRLHVAVAPVLVGAGRDGLQLAGTPLMRDNPRPECHLFRMGSDVLWDFDLRRGAALPLPADDPGIQLIG